MNTENQNEIIKLKEKFEKRLKRINENMPTYKASNNYELKIAADLLKTERNQLVIIVNALEKQIPMTVHYTYDDEFICPSCYFEDDGYDLENLNVCPKCGQRVKLKD